MFYLYSFIVPLIIFIALDLLWLGIIARNFYQSSLAFLLGPVNWWAAGCFYLLFIAGLSYFVLSPALQANSSKLALINGALLGLLCYATYDLTNLATIKDWPLKLTLLDMAWGAIIGLLTSYLSFKIIQALLSK